MITVHHAAWLDSFWVTEPKRLERTVGTQIAFVVLSNSQWPMVKQVPAEIASAVDGVQPGSYAEVSVPFRSPESHQDGPR